MSDLKHVLWEAFHAGGIWSLDAMEKKNDQSPKAAFDAWFTNTDPLMAHREEPDLEQPDGE